MESISEVMQEFREEYNKWVLRKVRLYEKYKHTLSLYENRFSYSEASCLCVFFYLFVGPYG